MNTQPVRKTLYVSFVLVLVMVLSACAGGGAQPAAPQVVDATEIVNTFTPVATSTPANTPTPQATATVTETPLPTATFTPNVTATLLPEIIPAAEGKGNIAGLVLWNNQPVSAWGGKPIMSSAIMTRMEMARRMPTTLTSPRSYG